MENIDDLIADLDQALLKASPSGSTETTSSEGIDCNDEGILRWVCASSSQPHGTPPVTRPTTIAVIGLSDKEGRPSYRVGRKMQRLGYKIIPINPSHKEILGEKCYKSLAEVDQPVDVIQVFRAKEYAVQLVKEGFDPIFFFVAFFAFWFRNQPSFICFQALLVKDKLDVKVFWLQEGVISEEAASLVAREGGKMKMVMNRCTYKECQRYMGPMATYG